MVALEPRVILAVRPLLVGIVVMVAVALAVMFPVLPDPTRLAIGHPANDVWNHLWGYGWIARCLAEGRLPLQTELLNWPTGGSLWFIDTFNAVATLPVQALGGPVAAYNAGIFGNLVLCGLGAWLLALRVTGSSAGALFAGVAYASAPHLLGQVYNGISETVAAGWLPLVVLGMREAARTRSPGMAALTGYLAGVNAVANWYYGLFAGLVLVGLVAREGLRLAGRRGALDELASGGALLGIGGLVAGVVMVGPFGLFVASMNAPDALVTRDPGFVWMTLVMHNMTDALALVRPGRLYSPDLKAMFDEDLLVVVYLGAALWVPGLWVLTTRRGRDAGSWALLAAGFVLLALGPFLYVGGAYVEVDGSWIPLPFLALFKWFPMFSRISHAYRFAVGASLALAVLGAYAVRALAGRGHSAGAVAGALVAARLVESFFLSPAVWPLPVSTLRIPEPYRVIHDGAVLDLPITLPVLRRAEVTVAQLVHGQPIPFGLNDPLPKPLYVNHYTRFLVELERSPVALLPAEAPWFDLAVAQAALRAQGMRWVVLREAGYPEVQHQKLAAFLDATATPVAAGDGVRVYELVPPGLSGAEAALLGVDPPGGPAGGP